MTTLGVFVLGFWVGCLPFAFRALARSFLGGFTYGTRHDPGYAAFAVFFAAVFASAAAPAIVAFRAAAAVWTGDDVVALCRWLAGESRDSRRARLQREIEQLDRELGLS